MRPGVEPEAIGGGAFYAQASTWFRACYSRRRTVSMVVNDPLA